MGKLTIVAIWLIVNTFFNLFQTNSLEVTATAYTSNQNETDSTPSLSAWGFTLKPGMKAIAVSRDLIKLGLTKGVEVTIDGLPGKYKVLDKMNKKWQKKIDIYMGNDVEKAKAWGKRKVVIRWGK
jgi:3D (Asp-Asp-Asp) domain-containing protein